MSTMCVMDVYTKSLNKYPKGTPYLVINRVVKRLASVTITMM